jgi:hypothetical protein
LGNGLVFVPAFFDRLSELLGELHIPVVNDHFGLLFIFVFAV